MFAAVLELSEKYQKCFDPLRYFVAGFLKFLCLPKYHFELEYLPTTKDAANSEGKVLEVKRKLICQTSICKFHGMSLSLLVISFASIWICSLVMGALHDRDVIGWTFRWYRLTQRWMLKWLLCRFVSFCCALIIKVFNLPVVWHPAALV